MAASKAPSLCAKPSLIKAALTPSCELDLGVRMWAPRQPAWSEMAVEGESIPVEVVRRMLLGLEHTSYRHNLVKSTETNRFFIENRCSVAGREDRDAKEQPLYKAVKDGDVPMVKALVAVGFDMEVVDGDTGEPYSALNAAAFHGHVDVVRVLLAAGADPEPATGYNPATGYRELTPLDYAAREGHMDVMRVLLEAGADADMSLYFAVRGGHFAAIQVLLDAGADVGEAADGSESDSDVDGEAPQILLVAVEYGHRNCLATLLRAGATFDDELYGEFQNPTEEQASALRYLKRVQDAGGYDQLVEKYRRVLTAPQSCLSWYLKFHCEIRFRLGAFPIDLVALVLEFWKPPGGP